MVGHVQYSVPTEHTLEALLQGSLGRLVGKREPLAQSSIFHLLEKLLCHKKCQRHRNF